MTDHERLPAVEPEQLERFFVERMNAGDVDGLVALFEPDAVMAHAPGRVASGSEEIRGVFEDMVASGARSTLGEQQPSLRFDDLALGSTRSQGGGVTAEVARRQPDGTWLWVLDRWNILDEQRP